MGQPTSIKINPHQWKEVIAQNTYICNMSEVIPRCHGCGNEFKKGEKITRLQLSTGVEYYHFDKCLKGVEVIGENPN